MQRFKKIRIFNACVCTKLSYGLFTAHLSIKERRRIDGFQARCLRQILNIAHSYYSRISNETVREIARVLCLSEKICAQQLQYMNKIVDRDDVDPARNMIFQLGSNILRDPTAMKKKGRPREKWVSSIYKRWFSQI